MDGTSFQVFWICKLWKERTKSQLNVITKFEYDSIAKLVLVQKRQVFCTGISSIRMAWTLPLKYLSVKAWLLMKKGWLLEVESQLGKSFKVDGISFRLFWICKLWKERTKNQLNIITKFVFDSIAKFVLVQKRQLFCHHLLPWQRYLMIVQTYFWASNAYILKTNLVTPNFFHISFFVIWKWNYMII